MRRGLTLIELLVSLALLSSIIAVATSWVQIAAGMTRDAMAPSQRQLSAHAVMELIHDDLMCGVTAPQPSRTPVRPCVEIIGGELTIHTRTPGYGPVIHRFRHSTDHGALELVQEIPPSANRTPRSSTRALLAGVRRFECQLDPETNCLSVVLDVEPNLTFHRNFKLP